MTKGGALLYLKTRYTFTLQKSEPAWAGRVCDPTCLLCIHWNVPSHLLGVGAVEGGVCGGGWRRALLVIVQTCAVCLTVRISLNIYIYITVYSFPPHTQPVSSYLLLFFHASSAPHMLRMAGRGTVTSQGESVTSDTKSAETSTLFCAT